MLTACGPARVEPKAAQTPPRPAGPEFANCAWENVKGAHLSIWGFRCDATHGGEHLEADDGLPGFYLANGDPTTGRKLVVRTFTIPSGASIEAILLALRATSPSAATCVLTPATGPEAEGTFTFQPTGSAKVAWDKQEEQGGEAEAPCGAYGVYIDRAPQFRIMPGHPDTVVYSDMGSEIQIFDPTTLALVDRR
jgi:hypothetical protein